MVCSLCSNVALRTALGKGFCRDHLSEAWEAAKKDKRLIESEASVRAWEILHRKRHEVRTVNSYREGYE